MKKTKYTNEFYSVTGSFSYCSASRVMMHLISPLALRSMLDVGCGVGTWGKAAKECGVQEYRGLDGNYINRDELLVDLGDFTPQDLTRRFELNRKFDIAICMEVAEHLPDIAADVLIESICNHSDLVLFSAAIPWQGGVDHVNEQWQSYWVDKFAAKGFSVFDIIRPLVWNDESVAEYYKQNALVYVNKKNGELIEKCRGIQQGLCPIINIVHPATFIRRVNPVNWSLLTILGNLPFIIRRMIKNRVGV